MTALKNDPNILVCESHQDYKTPLIWSFAFAKGLFWCPFCGASGQMIKFGKIIDRTPELDQREIDFKKKVDDSLYLQGYAILNIKKLNYEGKMIFSKDLPQKEKDLFQKIIDDYKFNIKVEPEENVHT